MRPAELIMILVGLLAAIIGLGAWLSPFHPVGDSPIVEDPKKKPITDVLNPAAPEQAGKNYPTKADLPVVSKKEEIPSVPAPMPNQDIGTLVLTIAYPGNSAQSNVELFVDGKFNRAFQTLNSRRTEFTLKLPPGERTLALKKYGVEVCSQSMQIKKAGEGKTFVQMDMVLSGTVEVRNARPVAVEVYVSVDNTPPTKLQWPIGSAAVDVPADMGRRVITVSMVPRYVLPGDFRTDQVIETFNVQVSPGKRTLVKMAK